MNRSASLLIIKIISLSVIALIITVYIISRSLAYSKGPSITIFQPIDGSSVGASTVVIQGRADRINTLSLNNQPISTDQQGNFSETVTIFPGVNILTLSAKDQFNRGTETSVHLFGTVDLPVHVGTTTTKAEQGVQH